MTAWRVLIVEDEPALARGLTDMLQAKGFVVQAAPDGRSGLDAALSGSADLILLDIMLPGVNGYEICRAVREHGLDMPILMLSARGQERDVVHGLNLGADDYLTKPFRANELVARARALLRRRPPQQTTCRFGDCEIDFAAHRVSRNGAVLDLTAKEYRLLAYFVERQGRALPRETILTGVWGSSVFVTLRSIDRCVATLRAKIEPDPHHPVHIQTVREIGYRFVADRSAGTNET